MQPVSDMWTVQRFAFRGEEKYKPEEDATASAEVAQAAKPRRLKKAGSARWAMLSHTLETEAV